ncbi:hypothetical protein JHJ32_01820 [Parapedobacter sp. ISTM3]|uniref:hypothetical protein n=1 Tax=Parapedobacter sp. ISTM3 TaxID=2800130 RepID=UPI0019043D35|nr:hypothetical protein [Parapedobacter sp. ISTM3]MBK1438715.1 hypothetical protein [Parapedobacter sp. ISTM3]
MKSLQHFLHRFVCCMFVAGTLLSCKRNIPVPLPSPETLHTVTFRLTGFEADVVPMRGAAARLAFGDLRARGLALRNIEPGIEPQYLYYWSFNNETLEPDIAIDGAGAGIAFDGAGALDFGSGFALAPFEAGQAWSIRGPQMAEISLPLYGVESLTAFAFDISSSNTGPKDFILTYSIDGGTSYETLSPTNQFENMGAQVRNSYSFDLGTLSDFTGVLKIRMEFLPGDREGAGNYNENTGVVKLDNIRIAGVYNGEPVGNPSLPDILHYFIFDADNGGIAKQQRLSLGELQGDGMVEVMLAGGTYDIVFLAYRSNDGILLPDELADANAFYFGQHFTDDQAITYASLVNRVEVTDADEEATVTLGRCYSLVEFDFTDRVRDLLTVKKIAVTRLHDNYLYTPFGAPIALPITDAHTMVFDGFTDAEDYRIAFHQFLGMPTDTRHVRYEVTAYDEDDELLNKFSVDEHILNSVQLKFSGRLLGTLGSINGFNVELDTEWHDRVESKF